MVVVVVVVVVLVILPFHVEVMRCFTPRVLVNPVDPIEIGTQLGYGRAFGDFRTYAFLPQLSSYPQV
jgi:hypothetical protein